MDLISEYKPKTVLDGGCGLGNVVKRLRGKGMEAYGGDFANCLKGLWTDPYFVIGDAKSLPFAGKTFDLVFSTGFFEHLPHFEIDTVYDEMMRVGNGKVLALVSCSESDGKMRGHQLLYHISNFPLEWWKEKLKGADVYEDRCW